MPMVGRESPSDSAQLSAYCAEFTDSLELIGRRWTGAIIRSMLAGATRFGDIRAVVPSLSDRLLSERLKELESEGIVERVVTPSMPVRVDYSLTAKGRALEPVVRSMSEWAENWGTKVAERPKVRRPSR